MDYHNEQMLKLDRLSNLANNPRITMINRQNDTLEAIERLKGRTCTGSVYWRDAETDSPKMIIVHKHGETCPIHGSPNSHKSRIRTYIGTDTLKQRDAQAAISRETQRRDLEKLAKTISHALYAALGHLERYYRSLGYTVPNDIAEYPEADPRWPDRNPRAYY